MYLIQAFFLGLGVFFIIIILAIVTAPIHFFLFLSILKGLANRYQKVNTSRKGKYLLILISLLITLGCFIFFILICYWFLCIYIFKDS